MVVLAVVLPIGEGEDMAEAQEDIVLVDLHREEGRMSSFRLLCAYLAELEVAVAHSLDDIPAEADTQDVKGRPSVSCQSLTRRPDLEGDCRYFWLIAWLHTGRYEP